MDDSGDQTSKALSKYCYNIGMTLIYLEEDTPWENKAELLIGLVKEAAHKEMKESDFPLALWDYRFEHRAQINNLTDRRTFSLHGANLYTSLKDN